MFTEVNGIKLNYERVGAGKPVLLLHGWGASIAAMLPVANCLTAAGRECVCLDFPGFGGSPAPKTPWSVRDYAVVTRAFISQQGITGCDVVCHSFGGRVTIMLAAEEPQLFSRLVMVDAAGVRPRRSLKYYVKTYAYKLGKRLSKVQWLDGLLHISSKQQSAGSADYRALSGVMKKTFVNVVNQDLAPLLGDIKNETLLVWGEKDTETPMYMAKLMEKRIPNAGLAVIPDAGHFSYADDYPRFCAIIRIMLAEQ